jgi:hypothetical protein
MSLLLGFVTAVADALPEPVRVAVSKTESRAGMYRLSRGWQKHTPASWDTRSSTTVRT